MYRSDTEIPVIPGTLIHREYGQPSQCHRCGWEGIPNSDPDERNLCPSCYIAPAFDKMAAEYGDHTRFLRQQRAVTKVPRNSPCPCGSGQKYKKCCETKEAA